MSTYAGSSGNANLPRAGESSHHGAMGFLKDLFQRLGQNDVAGLSAEMAYNWMLAMVPVLIFIFSIFGLISSDPNNFEQLMGSLQRLLPGDAYTLVRGTIEDLTRSSSEGLAIASLLGALWTGSNGAMVVEKALNRSYRCLEDDRGFIKQRLVALAIVAGMALILLVGGNLAVFGGAIIDGLEHYLKLDGPLLKVAEIARWLLPMLSLVLVSMYVYTIAPAWHPKDNWKKVWPGALTFVILWALISWLFSIYVSHMTDYSKVYGPMGAIIILMMWLYFTSMALLVGGEVNAMHSGCDEGELNAPPTPRT